MEKAEVTGKRRLFKRKRESDWREVRVGLARPVQNKEKRTCVARMSKYPEIVGQLIGLIAKSRPIFSYHKLLHSLLDKLFKVFCRPASI